MALLNVLLAI